MRRRRIYSTRETRGRAKSTRAGYRLRTWVFQRRKRAFLITVIVTLSLLLVMQNARHDSVRNVQYDKPFTGTEAIAGNGQERSIKGQSLFVYKPAAWASRPQTIYNQQVGKWIGPRTDVQREVDDIVGQAADAGRLALLVAYNIPGRDCGSYSAGGAGSSTAYRKWIDNFVSGVGGRKAIVVLEPDALSQLDCLDSDDQKTRLADLAYAVDAFKDRTHASVYIDAGNAGWLAAETIADRLVWANVASAAGFALNVSNFKYTAESVEYGEQISHMLAQQGVRDARYVVDTSRNGKGPATTDDEAWCNPPGRGLGKRPTTTPDAGEHNDAYLWIKPPGESDGTCKGGPSAGQWYPAYARMLVDNAVH